VIELLIALRQAQGDSRGRMSGWLNYWLPFDRLRVTVEEGVSGWLN